MLGPEPSSCRTLARALALDKSTVWQWRQRAARGFGARDHAALTAPIASGLAVVRESRKASREWVNYRRAPAVHAAPDRLRWVDYPRLGLVAPDHLPRYRIPIEISVDQGGRRAAEVLDCLAAEHWPPANARPPASSIAPIALRAADSDTPPLATCEAAGETARLGARPQSDVGAADRGLAAFGRFLRPFRGPATRHLPAYVAWFVTRNNSGEIPGALISGCPASLPSPAPD